MPKISQAQLAGFFRRMATSYSAGIDLKTILTRETETGSIAHRLAAKQLADEIQQGRSLAAAMRAANCYYPELVLAVVQAGEQGGKLDDAFDRLSSHYENLVAFRRGFLLSIAWPLFELTLAIIIIGLLILILGAVAGDEFANWFGMGTAWANFMLYVFCILVIAAAIGTIGMGLRRGWFGTYPMQIARRLPLIGPTIEALALSRFAWALSVAENSGMNAMEIVSLALQSTQIYFYERLIGPVQQSIRQGASFSAAFRQTSAFPEDLLIYMDNGEMAGQLAEAMDRASHDLQQRAQNNLKLLGTIGFVLTFLLVAVIIGTVVILMAQKLYLEPINQMLEL